MLGSVLDFLEFLEFEYSKNQDHGWFNLGFFGIYTSLIYIHSYAGGMLTKLVNFYHFEAANSV